MSDTSLIPPKDRYLKYFDILRLATPAMLVLLITMVAYNFNDMKTTLGQLQNSVQSVTVDIATQKSDISNLKDRMARAEGRLDSLTDVQLKVDHNDGHR